MMKPRIEKYFKYIPLRPPPIEEHEVLITFQGKCYIARRGYREGPWGFLIALCAALYPILSYLKARLEPPPERHSATELRHLETE